MIILGIAIYMYFIHKREGCGGLDVTSDKDGNAVVCPPGFCTDYNEDIMTEAHCKKGGKCNKCYGKIDISKLIDIPKTYSENGLWPNPVSKNGNYYFTDPLKPNKKCL